MERRTKDRNNHGITLIALVISIIVMLILAGVSINAIVGENGVLTKTQYATFLNEMAAVEEAVDIWKAGDAIDNQGETNAIPTNGMCRPSDVTSTDRLAGEVGYYRIWSMSQIQPTTNILSSASEFNSSFESELIFYPAGVQDLYYLNNEACGIDSKKTYVIDAATGMVYSMTGISLKGVSCYSSSMAKAVMNGISTAPNFAAAEVSGSGTGEALAGNNEPEFLPDGSKNPNYNPNGFQIIAHPHSDNIYKLYNNGDLYGKGVKGSQLNTPVSEMEEINASKWSEINIPTEIGSYKKVIRGSGTIFVIDSNDELWAWGSNANNKLGLSQEEQVEYTGREVIKLKIDGKKVSRVFDMRTNVYVITIDNCLYGAGANNTFQLGLGHSNIVNQFTKIDVPNPSNIEYITTSYETSFWKVIAYSNNTFYASGSEAKNISGMGVLGEYKKFVQVFNGYTYKENDLGEYEKDDDIAYKVESDIDQNIKKIISFDARAMMILTNNNSIIVSGSQSYSNIGLKNGKLVELEKEYSSNVKDIFAFAYGCVIWKEDDTVYGGSGVTNGLGFGMKNSTIDQITLPEELVSSGIKDIYTLTNTVYYLSKNNELYASSSDGVYVGLDSQPNGVVKLINAPKMETLYYNENGVQEINSTLSSFTNGTAMFKGTDGKLYSIGNSTILFRNGILQQTWQKIATNVKKVALGENQSIAYIDNNNSIFVAGDDSRMLAQNTPVQEKVTNFVKLDDVLVNEKTKEVKFSRGQMYILTSENDLYSTGIFSIDGSTSWPNDRCPGWDELENKYCLVKILDNVSVFDTHNFDKMAISNGSLFTWGVNYLNVLGQKTRSPKILNVSSYLDISKVVKIDANHSLAAMITDDGEIYTKSSREAEPSSFKNNSYYMKVNDKFNNEKVVDVKFYENAIGLVLTENGNVYGWGNDKYLGKGTSSETIDKNPVKLLEDVNQITVGSGFAIAIKKDGTVWGTGLNTYGILGRWIGIDRNSPNSRYKTAFEWVECPELEI